MKKGGCLFLAAVVTVVACAFLLRNQICRVFLPRILSSVTGVPCAFGDVRIGSVGNAVSISGLRIGNPPGFPRDDDMLIFDSVAFDVPRWEVTGGRLRFARMSLEVREIRITRNKDGRLNIHALKLFLPRDGRASFPETSIDVLDVSIRRVVYQDYTQAQPAVRALNVALSERFEDITDVGMFTYLLAQRVLSHEGLLSLLDAARRSVPVCFGDDCVQAQVAAGEESRRTGLMGREGLAPSEGMLFVFPREEPHSFWMKNMRFPIDIIWMASDGVVKAVTHRAAPCADQACPSFSAGGATRFVLEAPAGYAAGHGIETGTKAAFPQSIPDSTATE